MGWYFTKGATKAAIIAQITKEVPRQPAYDWPNTEQKSVPTGSHYSQKTLRQCVRGNVLWTVEEIVRYKEPLECDRFIGCYLLETRRGEAGYKPMDESMGPHYYSCPLSYLDMVPEANRAWREKVRAYHVEKTQQNSPPQQSPAETQPAEPEATITPEGSANAPDPVCTDCKPIISKGEDSRMPVTLKFKWTVSRARDTYGYNVCTLYADGQKVAQCNGGGYDMEGTVLGLWIAKRFAERLCEKITTPMYGLTFHGPDFGPAKAQVPDTSETVEAREAAGKSFGLERYQAVFSASSPLPTLTHRVPYLDGACGKECMIHILEAIGGTFKEIDGDRNHSIAIVSAPPTVQKVTHVHQDQSQSPHNERTGTVNQYEKNYKLLLELLPEGRDHIRIENESLLPLCVERVWDNQISLAHYGECNGDLMQDPEVVFLVSGNQAKPAYFRNAWAGVEHCTVAKVFGDVPVKPGAQRDLDSFVSNWWSNIKEQGFFEAAHWAHQKATEEERESPEADSHNKTDDQTGDPSAESDTGNPKLVHFGGLPHELQLQRYQDGNTALLLANTNDQEDVVIATVNVPEARLLSNQVLIKDYSEHQGMLDSLVLAGVVRPTGKTVPSGFVALPVCELLVPVPWQEREQPTAVTPEPTDRDREAASPSEAAVAPDSTADPERDAPTTRPEGRESQEREPGSKKPQNVESGVLRAFIWDNGPDRGATVTFSRIYKSQQTGEWAYSSSLRERDLNDLNKLVRDVARFLDHVSEQDVNQVAANKQPGKDRDQERER